MSDAPGSEDAGARGELLDRASSSLLEMVDNILDKGAVVDAELVLGLADVDLVYVRLSALICSADRVLPVAPRPSGPGPASPGPRGPDRGLKSPKGAGPGPRSGPRSPKGPDRGLRGPKGPDRGPRGPKGAPTGSKHPKGTPTRPRP